MQVLRIFYLLLMQRYENENVNTIVLFLLSSGQQVFWCGISAIARPYEEILR